MKGNIKWHPKFIEYMNSIIIHENYKGLAISKKKDGSWNWIATAKSETGKARIKWIERKADELGINRVPSYYRDVMFKIHPTKEKVCQICGQQMYLYYVYANAHLVKSLDKVLDYSCDTTTDIKKIIFDLLELGIPERKVKNYFIEKFKIQTLIKRGSVNEIIRLCEKKARNGNSALLGPGAMSNFPDRFDGYHTYNRCCRSKSDKGRSKENLRTYGKDRRAYEYWCDGNIHAANNFMHSQYFYNASADHIGPISLGFVHDYRFLTKISKGDNSSKRDRLLLQDVIKILEIEKRTGVCAISWFSKELWNHIKEYIVTNSKTKNIIHFRQALKQNMYDYLYILSNIKESCLDDGEEFLIRFLLIPKMKYFKIDYEFDQNGVLVRTQERKISSSTKKEFKRMVRISLQSLEDYIYKKNRNLRPSLTRDEERELKLLCESIQGNPPKQQNFERFKELINNIQIRKINELKQKFR